MLMGAFRSKNNETIKNREYRIFDSAHFSQACYLGIYYLRKMDFLEEVYGLNSLLDETLNF
jgi:hypothetical protein